MARIEITDLHKSFGSIHVLKDITLTVEDGEFAVLVGPSGCGKSTLLRVIAGLEDLTGGELRIGGALMNDVAPRDRDIAMVFQSYALYPHLDVARNMGYALEIRRQPKARIAAAISEAAATLGLTQLLDRRPRALSGGQRQRVAMGRAIVRHPKAFLFDEPLSNLDARLREAMRIEIGKLHRSLGATSVYVTHDQIEAMTMADKIVAMQGGVIQQIGSPLELYDDPANVFVAGFIGAPAMTFIDVDIASADGGIALTRAGTRLVTLPPHGGVDARQRRDPRHPPRARHAGRPGRGLSGDGRLRRAHRARHHRPRRRRGRAPARLRSRPAGRAAGRGDPHADRSGQGRAVRHGERAAPAARLTAASPFR